MVKKWEIILRCPEILSITSDDIKSGRFDKYFKDVNNPTDDEVITYFRSWLCDMSDPWEIPANGKMKLLTEENEAGWVSTKRKK